MTAKAQREARLAAQLRANLKRRKVAKDQERALPVVANEGEGHGVPTSRDANRSE